MKLQARLVKRFQARQQSAGFLLDVDFEVAAGITVLFGASGAGKSLTLDCIAGFTTPDTGRILLDDSILFDSGARVNVPPRDRDCGYVFQSYALFPHMTLRENLMFAAERRPRLERHRRVNEMMERFGLSGVAGSKPHELSGGQRQRCSIARALLPGPRMLLLDEPASGFDAALRADFYLLLRELRRDFQIPMLLVTHELDEAVALGDRMLVYEAGRIVQTGEPQAILTHPASEAVSRLLGLINIVPAEILALDPGRNSSRLRTAWGEIAGPYLPGYFIGDRAQLSVRAEDLRLHDSSGHNRVTGRVEGRVDHARFVELRFAGGLVVLAPRYEIEALRDLRDWHIEFPAAALRVLGSS